MRNHDELTLDKLTDAEREEVFAAFGPEPEMQLYGRGLRRRLPAMLGGDERRMRLVYSLMFSLPGTPVLFYGEEIGMAENLAIEGRYAVRAPMQWSREPPRRVHDRRRARPAAARRRGRSASRAGQRRAPAPRPRLAAQLDGAADPPPARVPGAGLGRLGAARRRTTAPCSRTAPTGTDSTIVAVHNLAARATEAKLALDADGVLVDLFGADELPLDGALRLPLEPYDHRWFRLRRPGQRVAP